MPTNIPGIVAKAQRVTETVCPSISGFPLCCWRLPPEGTVGSTHCALDFSLDIAFGQHFSQRLHPYCSGSVGRCLPSQAREIGTTKLKFERSLVTIWPKEEGKLRGNRGSLPSCEQPNFGSDIWVGFVMFVYFTLHHNQIFIMMHCARKS